MPEETEGIKYVEPDDKEIGRPTHSLGPEVIKV